MKKSKINILAAYMARSNMGQSVNSDMLFNAMYGNMEDRSIEDFVEIFCGELCESDDHFDMFVEEAKGWVEQLTPMKFKEFKKTWPEHAANWQEAKAREAAA